MKPRYETMTAEEHALACSLKTLISIADEKEFGVKKVAMNQHYINLAKDQLEKLVGDEYENIVSYFGDSEWDKTKVKYTGTQVSHVRPFKAQEIKNPPLGSVGALFR